jgi:UDP-glucose 4-epimerase
MANRTILITGVAGLLGSHLSRHLLKNDYTVIGIDDLSGGYKDFLPEHKNFTFINLNLEDKKSTNRALQDLNIDTVFHFAAYAAEGLSPFVRNFNYKNNVIASVNMINYCINNNCKLIFTSSMAVYGNQDTPFTENMIPRPIDPYGIAKFAVEMDIKQASEQFGLRYNIIRPHNVLGIYQNIWDRYRNVIGIFIHNTLNNKSMLLYGDGEQTRAFSNIKYYMEPFQLLIENHDNDTFNIGADKAWTIKEVANIVQQISKGHNIASSIEHVEPRHEVKHAFCNHTKAKTKLDFIDRTTLEELITEMFVWAKDQPKRKQKNMSYEVEKGIYEYWK